MKTLPLFVYGTLRRSRNRHRHPLLRKARFLQHASIVGELYDLGEYPGVYRHAHGHGHVFGELYELPADETGKPLDALDEYEGAEFERRRVLVTLSGGRRRFAWVYLLRKRPSQSARPIRSGRYHARGAA